MRSNTILVLFCLITLFACNNVQRQQSESEDEVRLRTIDSICVVYVENHLSGFNNEITREKTATELQRLIIDTLTANTNLLYELPLEYESVVDKGNKYIVRFSTGYHYQWTERRICDISLWLYSVVDDDNINRLRAAGRSSVSLVSIQESGEHLLSSTASWYPPTLLSTSRVPPLSGYLSVRYFS